jgi:DNA replication protein DnaC
VNFSWVNYGAFMEYSKKRLLELGIPTDYLKLRLRDYIGPVQYRNFVDKYCSELKRNKKGTGIYFFGGRNTGKTLLGIICMKAFLNSGFSALRVLCDDLIFNYAESLTDSISMSPFQSVHLLFLDDVGRERVTKISGQGISDILSYRMERNLPTIIGSSLPLEELDGRYPSEELSGLVKRKSSVIGLTVVEEMRDRFRRDRAEVMR